MKKILILLFLLLIGFPTFAKETTNPNNQAQEETPTLQCEITFDWISKTQIQRDENIKQIQNELFNEKTVLAYPRNEFKEKYANFYKDKDYVKHYTNVSAGQKEDDNNYYAGFFLKSGLLIAYGIQTKNNLLNVYYYDAMGNLRFIDNYSATYPNFPYYALQYDTKGRLIGTIYFISKDDQYIFYPDKTFKGRWYKEKMYNRNAKVIMSRSNW